MSQLQVYMWAQFNSSLGHLAIVSVINYTCAFVAMTSQKIHCKKSLVLVSLKAQAELWSTI